MSFLMVSVREQFLPISSLCISGADHHFPPHPQRSCGIFPFSSGHSGTAFKISGLSLHGSDTSCFSSLNYRARPGPGGFQGVSEVAAVSGCCRYERRLYEDWCQTVSEKSQYNLSLPLLYRDPNTKQLSVNFSPQVSWVTVTFIGFQKH